MSPLQTTIHNTVFWSIVLINVGLSISYIFYGYTSIGYLSHVSSIGSETSQECYITFLNIFTSMTILTPWLSLFVLIDA